MALGEDECPRADRNRFTVADIKMAAGTPFPLTSPMMNHRTSSFRQKSYRSPPIVRKIPPENPHLDVVGNIQFARHHLLFSLQKSSGVLVNENPADQKRHNKDTQHEDEERQNDTHSDSLPNIPFGNGNHHLDINGIEHLPGKDPMLFGKMGGFHPA